MLIIFEALMVNKGQSGSGRTHPGQFSSPAKGGLNSGRPASRQGSLREVGVTKASPRKPPHVAIEIQDDNSQSPQRSLSRSSSWPETVLVKNKYSPTWNVELKHAPENQDGCVRNKITGMLQCASDYLRGNKRSKSQHLKQRK